MAAKGNAVNLKKRWDVRGCSLRHNAAAAAAATTPIVATVPRRKETAATAAAAAAAGCTEHSTARQSTRRRVEVLRAANDGSAIDDIISILNKLPNGVGSAESCNDEAPGERRINLQFSSERRSDEQTAEDSGSKQVASSTELCCLGTACKRDTADGFTVSAGSTNFQLEGLGTEALGEKDSNNGSAENSVEDNAHNPPEGKKPGTCYISGSLERETNEQGLLPVDGFTMRQVAEHSTLFDSCEKMGEDDDSQVVDIILLDSHDEKMTYVGSQCSDEKMTEEGDSDPFGLQDMGDADSDIIYLKGFPSLDEMEDDIIDEMEDAMCEANYSDEETEEDEIFEQHHDFDENMGLDDACEQPQLMEVDDGSATLEEICEAFLCPEDCERILKLGLGTHVQYKKSSIVSWHSFAQLPSGSSYYRFSNIMPIEVVHVSNENSAEYNTHEEKSGGSDISALSSLLDDAVEVQFERGIVTHWACVDFSSLSYRKSLKLIDAVVDMCVTIGMKFYPFPQLLARVKPATFDDIGYTLLDMRKKMIEFSIKLEEEESAVFLLVILPDDRQYDERIKELCEILKVTYELCYPYYYNIEKWQLKETAWKIRSKVVKHEVRRRRLALPLVSEAPMIIFGADMFHCMPGEGSDAIATVVASLDWPKFRKYFIMESYQPYGEGIIEDLHTSDGGIMIDFFRSFYKRIKQGPQKIIFFRNGLERGQFSHICQQEINAIKQACAFFNNEYQPQLTYVVVLPTPFDMIAMIDKSKNILPGTEVDPTKFKFWCCHRGQKNFSLVCYHVVHDDNNFPVRELQSLTSKLCTFRHRSANPEIDIVPPAYFARNAALSAIQQRKTS